MSLQSRVLVAIFMLAGCSARPLDFPPPDGFVPGGGGFGGAGGFGGGGAGGNGGGGFGGNGGGGGSGGNPGMPPSPPRLIAPPSTAIVTALRPGLRWDMTNVQSPVTIDLCADRACKTPIAKVIVDASGAAGRPDSDLPPGVVFWRARAGSLASATWEFFVGKTDGGRDTVSGTVLDLDGDGVPDIAAAAAPNVLVYRGGIANLGGAPTILSSPDGSSAGFGYVMTAAGDLNGDGFGDLAVGECGTSYGDVFIYFGGANGVATMPSQALSTPDSKTGFGCRLAGGGDLDRDGYAELVVGRIGQDFTGGLYVYRGGPGGVPMTTTRIDSPNRTPSRLGYSIVAVGDVDGDGFPDFAASELEYSDLSGQVHLFRGGKDTISDARVVNLASDQPQGLQFGASLAAGNVDGNPDFVTAAPAVSGYKVTPVVELFHGGKGVLPGSGQALVTGMGELGFASEVESCDVDGDGKADIVAAGRDTLTVFISEGLEMFDVAAMGQGTNPRHVSCAGDLDGDGFGDVVVADGAGVEILRGGVGGLDRSRVTALPLPSGVTKFSGAVR